MAHPEIIEHEKAVLYVMEELFEQQMKQKETNEVMALKIHVIFKTLKAMFKFMNESNAGSDKSAKVHERLMKFVKQYKFDSISIVWVVKWSYSISYRRKAWNLNFSPEAELIDMRLLFKLHSNMEKLQSIRA